MRNAAKIEAELALVQQRRADLHCELEEMRQQTDKTRQLYLANEATVGALADATARVTALETAHLPLDAQIEALREELQVAQAAEAELRRKARLAEIEQDRRATTKAYYDLRDELNTVLAAYGERLYDCLQRFKAVTKEGNQLGGHFTEWMANREAKEPYGMAVNECQFAIGRLKEREAQHARSLLRHRQTPEGELQKRFSVV